MRIYEVTIVMMDDEMDDEKAKIILDEVEAGISNIYDNNQYMIVPPVDVTDYIEVMAEEDGD